MKHISFSTKRLRRALMAVLAAAIVQPSSQALASSRASCTMQVHVGLTPALSPTSTGGRFHVTRLGSARCEGMLADRIVDGAGWVDADGSYIAHSYLPAGSPLAAFDRCTIDIARISFFAAAPEPLSNRQFVRLEGQLAFHRLASTLIGSGRGRAGTISPISPGSQRLSYSALATFTPDRTPNCTRTSIRAGKLTIYLTITSRR
jgi:hypothetical protein